MYLYVLTVQYHARPVSCIVSNSKLKYHNCMLETFRLKEEKSTKNMKDSICTSLTISCVICPYEG